MSGVVERNGNGRNAGMSDLPGSNGSAGTRYAILVNHPIGPGAASKPYDGREPRKDYLLLAEALNARLLSSAEDAPFDTKYRLSFCLAQAWHAFRHRDEYDVILSMSEHVGLWLALLFKAARVKKPHVMVSHYLNPGKKALFLRHLHAETHVSKFVSYGPKHAEFLTRELQVPRDKVEVVAHAVDSRFWHPIPVQTEMLISSAGMTYRDYPTLVSAVAGLDVKVAIAAASPWGQKGRLPGKTPDNVTTLRCTPEELRDLYARSLFVSVPLLPNPYQAGSLVMYEAMAMGKAVVATGTEGQEAQHLVVEGETGYLVAPGDVQGWRQAIRYLCEHPDEARRMGERARVHVEEQLNLDAYVRDMVSLMHSVAAE